jgi:hypothetical protein
LSDERGRRVGVNEALFRQVNEQIRSLTDDLGTDGGTITVICECGDTDCTSQPRSPRRRIRGPDTLRG